MFNMRRGKPKYNESWPQKMGRTFIKNKNPGRAIAILLPRCRICNQVPAGGIRGGIRINKAFICSHCEQEITNTDAESSEYMIIIEKIKRIFK